jgi:hypothetical protein
MPARFTGETGTWRLSDAALKQVAAMIWEAGAAFPMLNAQKS